MAVKIAVMAQLDLAKRASLSDKSGHALPEFLPE